MERSASLTRTDPPISRKYRLGRVLGSGGMGTVYEAEHVVLGERVAVKQLRPEYAWTPEIVERFVREARSLFRIQCENVVRVLDVDAPENGAPFIVMEYVDGPSFETILERRGRLEIHEAVELARQTCEGLARAHRLGITHRDIKPPNVMVTARADGSACVKLVDFGIAHLGAADTALATRLTMTDATIGTPCYMAPEQLRSARAADARSDVWSVGVVLFELLTGDLPWDAESPGDLVFRQFTQEQDLAAFDPSVPSEIAAIVLRCLELDPNKRWQNADELAEALARHARPIAAAALLRLPSAVRASAVRPTHGEMPQAASSEPAALTFARRKVRTTHGGTAFERHELVPRGSIPTETVHLARGSSSLAPSFSSSNVPARDPTFFALILGVGGIVLALVLLLVVAATRGSSEESTRPRGQAQAQQEASPPPSAIVGIAPSQQPVASASAVQPHASVTTLKSPPATSSPPVPNRNARKAAPPSSSGGNPSSLYTEKW